MRHLLVTNLFAVMLLATAPANAEEATFSDEVFSLWSAAYEGDASQENAQELWQSQQVNRRARPQDEGNARDMELQSLTPNLDHLFGGSEGAIRGRESQQPMNAPQSMRHETFFENPPMTQSKTYSGDSDRDRHRRRRCGHRRTCRCNHPTPPPPQPPTPTPEPGTLFLAGSAAAAALAARRRARRQAAAEEEISD